MACDRSACAVRCMLQEVQQAVSGAIEFRERRRGHPHFVKARDVDALALTSNMTNYIRVCLTGGFGTTQEASILKAELRRMRRVHDRVTDPFVRIQAKLAITALERLT